MRNEKTDSVLHQFKEALKYYQYAYVKGRSSKTSMWMEDITSKYEECFRDFDEYLNERSFETRIRHLSQIADLMSISNILATIYLEIIQHHFHEGINAWQKGNELICQQHMAQCHFPLHEARKHGQSLKEVQKELDVLENDVHMHLSMTESLKARNTDIIDWYRQSILLAKELDVEQEAIALSRIGRVYAKVLKFKPQAKEYFRRALQLAAAMKPRVFVHCDWYNECVETMKKYQEETISHEQEVKDKERQKVKEEMKDELLEMEKKNSGMTNVQFLRYIYEKYPTGNTMKEEENSASMKKALLKAILHYHPDKVNTEEKGLKWKILTEEITKYLNARYEPLKSTTV
ncbi:uncharacterized protein LOC133195052 [Saccostrea echinata]|uniref:uncharacterized protein LOC133195052 n=1 Tax=Saccostrea echinata TaxID=191078 RepID=UPI002A832B3F|nr:uncharacterized protein LOC133195052 [Saccostrea echinata]